LRPYVVDASVAARFLLFEELSDRAMLVLRVFLDGSSDLMAPRLLVYEVGNTLWKAVREGILGPDEAGEKFHHLLGLKLASVEFDLEEYGEILSWSVKNDATYYDGSYVIASKKLGATLITADDALYQRASKEISAIHLRDYQ
jgi:predicted nucleic acid-binding protein